MGTQLESKVRIRFMVSILPGVHLRELQRLLGLSFNTTRYHVDRLTKTGEIIRVEDGGYSRLYPSGIGEAEKMLFPLFRGETNRKILESLVSDSLLSNKQLSDMTGLAKSTVSEHIADLMLAGIVKTRHVSDLGVVYELEQPERIRSLLRNQNPNLLKKASNRFIDLWDF